MSACISAGTRPSFARVVPIIKAIRKAADAGRDISYRLVYAGKEDDPTLEKSLFEDLQISYPDTYLDAGCENFNQLTGFVMAGSEHYLQAQPADAAIVADDLASTLAAATVMEKQGITLAHLVAGTRSFNINIPEEINRLVIDGLSDSLFTANVGSNSTTTREGVELSKTYMVGNILMDMPCFNHSRLQCPAVLSELGVRESNYIIFTLNRKALLADKANLKDMLHAMLDEVGDKMVLVPLRSCLTAVVVEPLGTSHPTFKPIKPLSYLQFGYLTAYACGVVTDSGNVAEEATFNSIPRITLNGYTEYIETVKVGSNVLVGEGAHLLGKTVEGMANGARRKCITPDRWDGRSAEHIIQILLGQP